MKKRVLFDSFNSDNEDLDFCFEMLQDDLNVFVDTDIVAFADLGLWQGRVNGYKEIGDKLKDVFNVFEDYNELYIDTDKDLKLRASHHDGTNYITFRAWRLNISDEKREETLDKIYQGIATEKEIKNVTKSLFHDIEKVYGY